MHSCCKRLLLYLFPFMKYWLVSGDTVSLQVNRDPSQFGTVDVSWSIIGLNGLDPSQGFMIHQGTLTFLPVSTTFFILFL